MSAQIITNWSIVTVTQPDGVKLVRILGMCEMPVALATGPETLTQVVFDVVCTSAVFDRMVDSAAAHIAEDRNPSLTPFGWKN